MVSFALSTKIGVAITHEEQRLICKPGSANRSANRERQLQHGGAQNVLPLQRSNCHILGRVSRTRLKELGQHTFPPNKVRTFLWRQESGSRREIDNY